MKKGFIHGIIVTLGYIVSGLMITGVFRALQISNPNVYCVFTLVLGGLFTLAMLLAVYYKCAAKSILHSIISWSVFLLLNTIIAIISKPTAASFDLMGNSDFFTTYNGMFVMCLGLPTLLSLTTQSAVIYLFTLLSVPAVLGILAGTINKLAKTGLAKLKDRKVGL
jgi:hypothetical protein